MPASLTDVQSISASADGSAWAVTKSQQIYQYDAANDRWNHIDGRLSKIAVGSASSIWGVDADARVWKYIAGGWEQVPGSLVHVSADSAGEVWGLNASHQVYKYVGGTTVWELVHSIVPGGLSMMDVAVGSPTNIWGIRPNMEVWRYVNDWAPQSGTLVQISAAGATNAFREAPTMQVWGVDAASDVWTYGSTGRFKVGSGFKQITVGSTSNAWAIDTNDQAICLTPPRSTDEGDEQWRPGNRKRWDSKDKYDQFQSTHLWIVSRAAEVAKADPRHGERIFDLVQPGAEPGQNEFHDGLAEGLWDADEADPYRNSVVEGDNWFGTISATYHSHFYDPTTGLNWIGGNRPTALTQGPIFFDEATKQYAAGHMRAAGYNLGLSLHYLTDMTQPMHTINFSHVSSIPFGYHGAFEKWAIKVMKDVQISQPYSLSTLGTDPSAYIKAAAVKSRPRGPIICSLRNLSTWTNPLDDFFHTWRGDVKPEIQGALIDGVAITSQYLIAWMENAQPAVPTGDPRLFAQAYGGPHNNYWALDDDGHLFHRTGWYDQWILVTTPNKAPVVSLWLDADRGVFVVSTNRVWYLADKNWTPVYPPVLVDKVAINITQLAVIRPSVVWGLDASGIPFQGEGMLPDTNWTDTSDHGKPVLTSLSASGADSAWGANAADKSAWEYTGGKWVSRGGGVVHVSVDDNGQPWGISAEGTVVTYIGSSWQTPPQFSDRMGNLLTPDWGPLAWINARGVMLIVDRQGIAWGPAPFIEQGQDPWMPLG